MEIYQENIEKSWNLMICKKILGKWCEIWKILSELKNFNLFPSVVVAVTMHHLPNILKRKVLFECIVNRGHSFFKWNFLNLQILIQKNF